ncbi:MAG: hypothetical protein RugAbin2_02405 [Rugosibacter sp.]|nr:hypothetical protein [Rugosibacter sp.]
MEPLSLIAGLLPLIVEGGKAAISRWVATDNFKPATVADYLAIRKADLDLFAAVSTAGGTNPSYLWVEAVVRLMRPSVAMLALGTWAYQHVSGVADTAAVDQFAQAVGFYLFADRTLFYARQGLKK